MFKLFILLLTSASLFANIPKNQNVLIPKNIDYSLPTENYKNNIDEKIIKSLEKDNEKITENLKKKVNNEN